MAGELKDLAYELSDGDEVEGVEISSEDGLNILRHSTAHVMAQAVQELFPEAKLGIGPPVKDGFYYDFDVEKPFTPEDLKAIEKKMQEIQSAGRGSPRRVVTDEAAREELANEPYKLELIGLKGSASHDDWRGTSRSARGELTIYDNLDAKTGELCWKDLCRGPHLPSTRLIPAFKLMRNAAAYWRGSEKNPMLQRIYGTAWPSKDELKAHLDFLAEAEKRDHRKLGTELDLFSIPEQIGSGLAVFHPKGRHRPPGHGGLLAAPPRGRGLRVRLHPARDEGEALRDVRAPRLVRRGHVPAHAARRGAWTTTSSP
ncbi:hypothetical protein LT493_07385 [Streptomyces tricolor]|nr:hypothetical protein [Streptomyces tricolor]